MLDGTSLHFSGPFEIINTNLTDQAASIGSTTIYTTVAPGLYRMTGSIQTITAGTAGTALITIANHASSTIDLVVNGNNQSISSTLYVAAATPIQYSTTVAGNSDGMYRIDVAVERLD